MAKTVGSLAGKCPDLRKWNRSVVRHLISKSMISNGTMFRWPSMGTAVTRFGMDGVYSVIGSSGIGHTTSSGPLLIGSTPTMPAPTSIFAA